MNRPKAMLEDLSIVIPVGPGEMAWQGLLSDLKPLPSTAEVLLVAVDTRPNEFLTRAGVLQCPARWLQTEAGRGRQMNFGAIAADRRFFWFLHADSRVDPSAFDKLNEALRDAPDALHFFELAFLPDGPLLSRLNAVGANLRSKILHLPFGDQGFCLSARQFHCLGGFDESIEYGEDHLFIWQAHRNGVRVRQVAAAILTSARKYSRNGWLRTTLNHLFRTGRQALPQLAELLIERGTRGMPIRPRQSKAGRLIVFTRCPEPGRCKTRLIPALGENGAVAVHEALVRRTMSWMGGAIDAGIAVEVRYSGSDLDRLRALCGDSVDQFNFRPQQGDDLGVRLKEAAETAFEEGASKVAIIGTDCPDLHLAAVSEAFTYLDDRELVLGPAADGGYNLIAMRRPCSEVFDGISWGGSTVLRDTLGRASELRMTVELLPALVDVDSAEDLNLLDQSLMIDLGL